jgi:hypothetical protein
VDYQIFGKSTFLESEHFHFAYQNESEKKSTFSVPKNGTFPKLEFMSREAIEKISFWGSHFCEESTFQFEQSNFWQFCHQLMPPPPPPPPPPPLSHRRCM